MLILNKASVDFCPIRRSHNATVETGLRFQEQLFYPCGSFAPTEMKEAIAFYRSCAAPALILSDDSGYQVWCNLPTLETAEAEASARLKSAVA